MSVTWPRQTLRPETCHRLCKSCGNEVTCTVIQMNQEHWSLVLSAVSRVLCEHKTLHYTTLYCTTFYYISLHDSVGLLHRVVVCELRHWPVWFRCILATATRPLVFPLTWLVYYERGFLFPVTAEIVSVFLWRDCHNLQWIIQCANQMISTRTDRSKSKINMFSSNGILNRATTVFNLDIFWEPCV